MSLVTGASGFLGGALIPALNSSGFQGWAVSRTPIRSLLPGWCWLSRNEFNWLNPASHTLLAPTSNGETCDAVIHLEVKQHVQNPTGADLRQFQEVNVHGTEQWLNWCSAVGVKRFVYFSSIKAVRGSSQVQDEETSGPHASPYGESKWRAEQLVVTWAKEDEERSALILRPAVVYGPKNTANVFAMVDSLARGRFFLIGRNDNVKSLISVKNLCAAVSHLLPWMTPGLNIYNLVDERSYSVRGLANMLAKHLGIRWDERSLPVPLAHWIARFGDVFTKVSGKSFPLTSSRLEALLETTHFSSGKLLSTGFRHPQTTEEGLAEMVEWYKSKCRS